MVLNIKRKERKALNSSLYSSTHRNARTIKLVSLRVRLVRHFFFFVHKFIPLFFLMIISTKPLRVNYKISIVCGKGIYTLQLIFHSLYQSSG